jgi:hypothetical protein
MKKFLKWALIIATLVSGLYTFYLIGKDVYPHLKGIDMAILIDHLASVVVILIFLLSGGILLYGWYTENLKRRNIFHISKIIKDPQGAHYIVKGNTCYVIPNEATFEYLGKLHGFWWNDAKPMSSEDIKRKFVMGKELPSILEHCPKKETEIRRISQAPEPITRVKQTTI